MTASTPPAPPAPRTPHGILRDGDQVQLTDPKGRINTLTLQTGKQWHGHKGWIAHDEIIGRPEGIVVRSTGNIEYLVFRPLLQDFAVRMPRGAAVVYPKDAGQIVAMADIFPGARVVEAGAGSGALSCFLLRAVGEHGSLSSYERREDFAEVARKNVEKFFGGPHPSWKLTVGALEDAITETDVDRVVLDLPEPWQVVPHAEQAMRPGGILVAYTPSVIQVSQLRDALAESRFFAAETVEIMQRGWYVENQAVRPDHRMVGHTGFLTHARLGAR